MRQRDPGRILPKPAVIGSAMGQSFGHLRCDVANAIRGMGGRDESSDSAHAILAPVAAQPCIMSQRRSKV